MGAIITLSLLGLLILYLGLYKAKKALLPVTLIGLALALFFELSLWGEEAVPLYNGMVLFDKFALIFSIVCIVLSGLILCLSRDYFHSFSSHVAEYYTLIIFSLTGAVLITSYHNFAILFIGIEIMSLAVYVLTGIRKTNRISNEATLKYFIMGAFSTGFLLFGITLMYGVTGSFDLAVLKEYVFDNSANISPLFYSGILLLLIGLCFKVGAAPFHFWTPDVYDGAPILITTYMSTVVKIASFAAFFRFFSFVLVPLNEFWTPVLLTIVIITLFIGNITALMQSSFKRMLAYSSVSHAGYMLFAVIAVGANSSNALLIYALAYSLASIIAFGGLYIVKKSVGSELFESFNGLSKKNPALAALITVAMLSLAGIPLTAGFMGKFMMFHGVMNEYYVVLLILAAVNAVIGVFYYLRVVVHMYFKEADNVESIDFSLTYKIVFIIALIGTLVLGVYPDTLLSLI